MNCTLVVMAAGIGSRFGGLKQLEPMGVSGETIAEFSVYDAIRAGFTRVVFIIKPEMREDFVLCVTNRFSHKIQVDFAYQRVEDVPVGCAAPEGRTRPLGTAHAVYCCRELVREPFAVINADDFYGASAFAQLHRYLTEHDDTGEPHPYCMAAYALRNTVSEHGSVSRGVCEGDAQGFLKGVVERVRIERVNGGLCAIEGDEVLPLGEGTPVSMNTWGFTPSIFPYIEMELRSFLRRPQGDPLKAECFLPTVVERMLERKQATVRMLMAEDRWIGITYPQDKQPAKEQIRALIAAGQYPDALWR